MFAKPFDDGREAFHEALARHGFKRFDKFYESYEDGDELDAEYTLEDEKGGGNGGNHGWHAGDATGDDPKTCMVFLGYPGDRAYEGHDGVDQPDEDDWSGIHFSNGGFFCTSDGVFSISLLGLVKICAPMLVLTHVETNGNFSRQIKFVTRAGKVAYLLIPDDIFYGNCNGLPKLLARRGLAISIGQELLVAQYVQSANPDRIATGATVPGWQESPSAGLVYVLPDMTVIMAKSSRATTRVVPASTFDALELSLSGTLGTWKAQVATPACKLRAGILALCAGFAPVLLRFAPEKINFLLNFYGRTSKGKSTLLQIAASVWGSNNEVVNNWNGTEIGLIDMARGYRDRAFILDEMGAGAHCSNSLSKILYSLASAKDRTRGSGTGKVRGGKPLRTLAISSGEYSIHAGMSVGSNQPNRGTIHRGIDIEILDAVAEVPEMERDIFAEKLSDAIEENHGTAARQFIRGLVEQFPTTDSLKKHVRISVSEIMADFGLPMDDSAINRGLKRFALLAVAGELAVQQGLLPIADASQVRSAIGGYAAAWHRMHSPQSVQDRMIERIGRFILRNQTRFQQPNGHVPANRAGWDTIINSEPCFAFTAEGLEEAANERDKTMVAQTLLGAGLLVQNDATKLMARLTKDRTTGQRPYAYAISKTILTYLEDRPDG